MAVKLEGEGKQLTFPFAVPGKRHLACGGRLVYSRLRGGVGYRCENCGVEYLKRGYSMPFPKGTEHARDIAKGIPLDQVDGQTFLLERVVETFEPEDDIKGLLLYVKTEDGSNLILGTTSDVVRKQLHPLDGKLPILITPTKVGRYFTIY